MAIGDCSRPRLRRFAMDRRVAVVGPAAASASSDRRHAGTLASMTGTPRVALLRGINLGSVNRIPMTALRELAESIGFSGPVTHLQSGNLVFETALGEIAAVKALESAIAGRFGFEVPVVMRSAEELIAVAARHPLAGSNPDPKKLVVAFLDLAPEVPIEYAIDPEQYLPDRYQLEGRDLYLEYPNGFGRSKLSHSLIERRLEVGATIRNWNTVTKLAELAGRMSRGNSG